MKLIENAEQATQSAAAVQAEFKTWADWLVRVEAHPVGAIALAALGVFAVAEMFGWWTTNLLARRGAVAADRRRIRNKIGPAYNIIGGLIAVGATGLGGKTFKQVWIGLVIAALSFGLHFVWIYREPALTVLITVIPMPRIIKNFLLRIVAKLA